MSRSTKRQSTKTTAAQLDRRTAYRATLDRRKNKKKGA